MQIHRRKAIQNALRGIGLTLSGFVFGKEQTQSQAAGNMQFESATELLAHFSNHAPVERNRVHIETPRLADNGLSVPVHLWVDSPMTELDHVTEILLLSLRNPRPMMARFKLSAAWGKAEISTRTRLNGSQTLWVLAKMSNGSWYSGSVDVEVTESACLDAS